MKNDKYPANFAPPKTRFMFSRKIEVPHEALKLDKILELCRWRFGNHYLPGQWEEFAKQIAGSDSRNPLFIAFINELVEEKYITKAPENLEGYISTGKGLMFKGYAKTYIDKVRLEIAEKKERIFSRLITIGAVIVGALLTHFLTPKPPTPAPTTNTIVLPSIQIVHDTIRIHEGARLGKK
jgi:hypothetical protein